ncbi:sulfate ABC transporter substrate-binding protein, partial [Mesorhizobium sp. M00.F.Ca.ET.149.01.1.1]
MKRLLLGIAAAAGLVLASSQAWSADKLLNASYDVGRGLFAVIIKAFV